MKSSYKLAISDVELSKHSMGFLHAKYYDKIQSVLLDHFIKRILLISEE